SVDGAHDVEAPDALRRSQERRRPEEQSVDDAEHRGVRADAETEREYDRDGESRLETESAQCVPEILSARAPPFGPTLLPDERAIDGGESLARALDVAEPPLGLLARFVARHAAGHEIPHRHLEVKTQLVVHGTFDPSA